MLRNIGQVTSFTDRPARRAGTLSPRRLVRRWRALGFVEDPPNAALVLADAPRDNDIVILELGRPRLVARGRAIALRAQPVPQRNPDALARFVRRADRRVAVRFGPASLFIDPSGQQTVTVSFAVTGLGNSILSINLDRPWTVSQLEAELRQAPLTATSLRAEGLHAHGRGLAVANDRFHAPGQRDRGRDHREREGPSGGHRSGTRAILEGDHSAHLAT